jgi:hypothetical protein
MAWTLGDATIPPYLGEGNARGLLPELLAGAVLLALAAIGWSVGSAFLRRRLPFQRARTVMLRVRLDGEAGNSGQIFHVPAGSRVLVHVEQDSAAHNERVRGG